ncbi:MAG: class I SAM-dependent methyltransferase [Bacteroidetes bacterium]|nr:MAG: class I SAM-dependent methyltransferase [Bacteroidota bacterium]
MLEFHTDYKRYFALQYDNARQAIIPFIEEIRPLEPGMRLLEIGCGQGSLLKAFAERGLQCVGVEMFALWLEMARENLATEIALGSISIIDSNIYDVNPNTAWTSKFDIIVLKDVIEHIHDQKKLMSWMKSFLNPGGMVFFAFPPWQMPYGGHQQVMPGWLGKTPYWHLLPMPLFKALLKANKTPAPELVEIKETGISIERFERIAHQTGYTVQKKQHWLINPVYQYKFGWKPRKQLWLITKLVYIRNFFTTGVFYALVTKS